MTALAPRAVVVVPTFRRPQMLRATLASLKAQQTDLPFVVLVVENDAEGLAGQHAAFDFFARERLSGVAIVAAEQGNVAAINAGFAAALARFPGAEHFLMIDDDEVASPRWLALMVGAAERSGAGIVGGPVTPRFEASVGRGMREHPVFWPISAPTGDLPMIYGSGNCLIRRAVFERLGLPAFDPAFNFLGGGDSDFFTRARLAGERFYWQADALVTETVPATRTVPRWVLKRGLRVGAINRRIERKRRAAPLVLAKDLAILGVSPFRFARELVRSRSLLRASYPVSVALGRLLSIGGIETGQYRARPCHLVLVSEAEATCGVEEFARQMARRAGAAARPLGDALEVADDLVLNLPVVAWKKRLFAPIAAAARARLAGRQVTVILHEWADLRLARRLAYLPLLPLATRLLFSAPEVRAQFEATPVARVATRARGIMPIPPNFSVPEWTQGSALADRLAAARAGGRLVVAQFGSIYPRKDPLAFLGAVAELARRGVDVEGLMIGGFVRDSGDVEGAFNAEMMRLGLAGRVTVTGYVRGAPELYGLFAEVDAFLYPLGEGLTSRRASVLAAALSGRPVVASAPARADALAHHALFRTLVERGAIRLVPRGAGAGALADAVLATRGLPARPLDMTREVETVWQDALAALEGRGR